MLLLKVAYLNNFTKCLYYSLPVDASCAVGDLVLARLGSRAVEAIILELVELPIHNECVNIDGTDVSVEKIKDIEVVLISPFIQLQTLRFLQELSFYNISSISKTLQLTVPKYFLNYLKKENYLLPRDKNVTFHQESYDRSFTLNEEQSVVSNSICQNLEFNVSLIYGTTGSGKTYVFADIASKILENYDRKNKQHVQILVLVPEIALTHIIYKKLQILLPLAKIAMWHSKVSPAKRRVLLTQIMNGEVQIVVGTRSALLLQYNLLKAIIVDEEHDSSYKQGDNLPYNARDMAVMRGSYENIPIILASATPSIESFANVLNGRYKLYRLNSKYFNVTVPDTILVSSKRNSLNSTILCEDVINELKKTINNNKQAMIFINRRGFSRMLYCSDCKKEMQCINCNNMLSYHKRKNYIKCHYCNYTVDEINKCLYCHSKNIKPYGRVGVERLQEEVLSLQLKECLSITLFSSDEVKNSDEIDSMSEKIINGNVDIIIGTQIVTKGYHFPKLQLVVILDIDNFSNGGDFRLFEKLFQLLTQLSGRAGREESGAKILIQTGNHKNETLLAIQSKDSDNFYQLEISRRRKANLPPFSRMISIIISGSMQNVAKDTAKTLYTMIVNAIGNKVQAFGPSESAMHLLKKRYRYSILLNFAKTETKAILIALHSINDSMIIKKSIHIKFDVDPQVFD